MIRTVRKPLGAVAGGLALMLALSSCGLDDSSSGAEGSDGGTLTIYTARDKGLAEAVVADFEAANPDYAGKVEILTLGAQEALERIRAEKANPQGDIWWGGTGQQMKQAAGDDVLRTSSPSATSRPPAPCAASTPP
ncbi:MAG: iron transporter substrate-binding protein [Arthrobacter koreensis]|uniref:hypothetical protein n=1 Tax=Arthrobacter koreensis TaxID=199136 RepID=UPI00240940BA|nr:hypothetical protein [Arthrobacter koreensis]MDF2498376.1 iron transporter substrate-binding protein [Arthrobacter koreensis]